MTTMTPSASLLLSYGMLFLLPSMTTSLPQQMATTSRLQVHIPQSMARRYPHQAAMFGMESLIHGRSLVESLYFLDNDLCNWESIDNKRDDLVFYPSFNNRTTAGDPFLVMIQRGGGCTFVQKVRNAQRLGAAGVLIADDVCLCQDKACMHDSKANGENTVVCQQQEPVMADDGSGHDISIPSFLVDKTTADLFLRHLKQAAAPMRVEMAFDASSTDPSSSNAHKNDHDNDLVQYDLWTQPTIPDNMNSVAVGEFWSNLKVVAQSLPQAQFTPHVVLYDGVEAGCHKVPHIFEYDSDEDMPCYNLCTNRGRYCAADPDGDLYAGLSGQDVVRESLRRLCIWELYGVGEGNNNNNSTGSDKFFDYAVEFQSKCYSDENPLYFRNEVCVAEVYNTVGIQGDKVHQCMQDSGGLEQNVANTKLDKELNFLAHKGVYVVPTLQVMTTPVDGNGSSNPSPNHQHHGLTPPNSASYRSLQGTGMTPSSIFSTICQSWASDDAPAICQACANCPHAMNCLRSSGTSCTATGSEGHWGVISSGNGVSIGTFLLSVVCLTILAVGSAFGHRQYRRQQMRSHVQTLLAEYNYTPLGGGSSAEDHLIVHEHCSSSSSSSTASSSSSSSSDEEMVQGDCFGGLCMA